MLFLVRVISCVQILWVIAGIIIYAEKKYSDVFFGLFFMHFHVYVEA